MSIRLKRRRTVVKFDDQIFAEQWQDFQLLNNKLASEGYLVFTLYPRGSDSYPMILKDWIIKDWISINYMDAMTGVDYLIKKGIYTPSHN